MAVKELLRHEVPCTSNALGDDTLVVVGPSFVAPESEGEVVRALGLINAVVYAMTGRRLHVEVDEDSGEILRFGVRPGADFVVETDGGWIPSRTT
ncbi:hypothetical protein B1759_15025 [Rubrivirga sp. SAORIC476]|uniref:hypothetical protein n=1 Tax=Rubrivirga sp. SAORIC476 TaxID=1961794 RepID=UPI000BA94281|nr:hypothetical protein [Rubrivirga sp. SAORIC476]PAP79630.1 hypothetical protein B1759_15025 [Rubrivirga sp. SAORIC476]